MNERLEVVVYGRVQRVMFRDYAARKARRLGLVGEVKNLPDGTVRVVAEGVHPALEDLCARLKHGSLFSRVDRLTCTWRLPTGEYKSFDISYE